VENKKCFDIVDARYKHEDGDSMLRHTATTFLFMFKGDPKHCVLCMSNVTFLKFTHKHFIHENLTFVYEKHKTFNAEHLISNLTEIHWEVSEKKHREVLLDTSSPLWTHFKHFVQWVQSTYVVGWLTVLKRTLTPVSLLRMSVIKYLETKAQINSFICCCHEEICSVF
jgi:hypothetical protein